MKIDVNNKESLKAGIRLGNFILNSYNKMTIRDIKKGFPQGVPENFWEEQNNLRLQVEGMELALNNLDIKPITINSKLDLTKNMGTLNEEFFKEVFQQPIEEKEEQFTTLIEVIRCESLGREILSENTYNEQGDIVKEKHINTNITTPLTEEMLDSLLVMAYRSGQDSVECEHEYEIGVQSPEGNLIKINIDSQDGINISYRNSHSHIENYWNHDNVPAGYKVVISDEGESVFNTKGNIIHK